MTSNHQSHSAGSSLILWVIWGALTASIVVYVLVLKLTGSPSPEGQDPPDQNILMILGVAAVGNLAIGFAIRHLFTNRIVKDENSPKQSMILPSCIISWAMVESVAVFGLMLGFLGASATISGSFMLVSFVSMLLLAPPFGSLKKGVR